MPEAEVVHLRVPAVECIESGSRHSGKHGDVHDECGEANEREEGRLHPFKVRLNGCRETDCK